ncbi:MAG: hypothetical protein EBX21_04385, partial [Proteobacteria bacterium]|nr:hypothetical protein [Pseudomonadota bacterium]
ENQDFQIADMSEVLFKLDLNSDSSKYFKLLSHKKNSDSFFGAFSIKMSSSCTLDSTNWIEIQEIIKIFLNRLIEYNRR